MPDPSAPLLDRIRRAHVEPVRPIDVAIAVALAALSLVPVITGAGTPGAGGALGLGLLLLESLPLAFRRRYPVEVFLVVISASIVQIALIPAGQELVAGLGILVAMYTIGERLDRELSLPLAALAGTVLGVLLVARGTFPQTLPSVIQTEVIIAVAWLVGDGARIRRLYAATLEERALFLERERDERDRRAVLEERQRIARELHDVVGHHMSVVVVQAGGAISALDTRPDDVRTALTAIGTAGRQALTDMRRLVSMIGADASDDPMPGLQQLDTLIAQVRTAGLSVDLVTTGERRALDPGLDLSAYRIVQEALTNALKHGGGSATATLAYERDALRITVDNRVADAALGSGATPAFEPDHVGHGLMGMRERVAMFRGSLEAGPTAAGFRVVARLPFPGTGLA